MPRFNRRIYYNIIYQLIINMRKRYKKLNRRIIYNNAKSIYKHYK